MTKRALMVGLGEILWDLMPAGRVLGGAPANFAYMASILGDQGAVASRIGKDELGAEVSAQLQRLGLSTAYLQEDVEYGTGTARVTLDAAGQPTFTIEEPVAWDRLMWTDQWLELSAQADVICFGSLAQRAPLSSDTIDRFLCNSRSDALRIFDVNLRQSYYSPDVLQRSLRHANIVKLSDQELSVVASMLRLGQAEEEELARSLLQECDLELVCITRGARGSLLVSEQESIGHPGFAVKVVDAVGAGDAYTACLAHHLVQGSPLRDISEYANRFASWVATQVGATPAVAPVQLQEILRNADAGERGPTS